MIRIFVIRKHDLRKQSHGADKSHHDVGNLLAVDGHQVDQLTGGDSGAPGDGEGLPVEDGGQGRLGHRPDDEHVVQVADVEQRLNDGGNLNQFHSILLH